MIFPCGRVVDAIAGTARGNRDADRQVVRALPPHDRGWESHRVLVSIQHVRAAACPGLPDWRIGAAVVAGGAVAGCGVGDIR